VTRDTRPILITGGAGFIGSNLADRLASEGNAVIVLDSLARAGVEENLAWLKQRHPERITSVAADLRDADAVNAVAAGARAVFHLAAQVAVTTSLVDPRDDFETNVGGTLNLLEALRRRGDRTPLIFASTNKVYGDLADIPLAMTDGGYLPVDPMLRARGVAEGRPLEFHTPYGCSKGAADQYVLDYARSFGLPTCVIRMSCIYGPRQMGTEDQGWVAHFLIRALRGEPISIYGDGCQVRDILHVSDAVDAYVAAWRQIEAVRGRAFNLGGGASNAVSLRQLIGHIEELVGHPVDVSFSDWRAGDQRYFVADAAAMREAVGLREPMGWREGVAGLAAWLRDSGSRRRPVERPRDVSRTAGTGSRAGRSSHGPLRLMMTADAVGGVWTYAVDLAGSLAPFGVQTTIAVLGPAPSGAQRAEAAAVPGLELLETGLALDWTAAAPGEIRDAGEAVADLAADLGADLVHLNGPALTAGRRFPAPVVGVCHSCLATWWAAVRGGAMPEDFQWRAQATRDGLVACDVLVAPTAAFAEATARAYGLPRPLTVHNGRRLPASLGMAARPRQVFTAGRLWDDGKNVAALDAVAAMIDAPLFAAGPLAGPNGDVVSLKDARQLGPLPSEGVRGWLARSPVFASVPLYEPFGLAVLEAAQAGCALLLSDIPSFRELWDDAAVFVRPNQPLAIAAAAQALIDAPDRAAALGAAAQARARRYSLEAMAGGMLGIYGVLLASRPPRLRAEVAA
jgi:CDP-paratose 2-epimerase